MTKTKTMRVGAWLMALALATTCFVGGTFAKYVTEGKGDSSARVAQWGVVAAVDTDDTFNTTYAKDDATVTDAGITNTVVSTAKVVAPGTKGNLASFNLSGTPEVAVKVAFTGTLTLENWMDEDDAYYCPIEITIGTDVLKGNDYADADAFKAAVEEKIAAAGANYAAGTDMSTATVPAISWSWAFEGNDDVKDTFLGDQAALGNAATIQLELTVTATQID